MGVACSCRSSQGSSPVHTLCSHLPALQLADTQPSPLNKVPRACCLLEIWQARCAGKMLRSKAGEIWFLQPCSSGHEPVWTWPDSLKWRCLGVWPTAALKNILPAWATASFSLLARTVHHLKQFSSLLVLLENKDLESKPLFKLEVILWRKWDDWTIHFVLYFIIPSGIRLWIWFDFYFHFDSFSLWPWVRDNIKSNVCWWVYLSESVKKERSNRNGSGAREGRREGEKVGRKEEESKTMPVWKGKLTTVAMYWSASIFNMATDIVSQSSII